MKINSTFLKGVLYSSEELCDTGNLRRASYYQKAFKSAFLNFTRKHIINISELYFLPARNALFTGYLVMKAVLSFSEARDLHYHQEKGNINN